MLSEDAKILKTLRADKNLSQQKLSDIIGVSKQFISLVEINRAKMSDDFLSKLKKHYPDYLPVPNFIFPEHPSPSAIKSFRSIYKLTQNQLAKITYCRQSFIAHYEQNLIKEFPLASYELMKQYANKNDNLCNVYYFSISTRKPSNEYITFDIKAFNIIHCECTYIVEMFDNSLAPDYYAGDRFLIDTYYKEFARDCKTLFFIGDKAMVSEFYDGQVKPEIIGRLIPKVRF